MRIIICKPVGGLASVNRSTVVVSQLAGEGGPQMRRRPPAAWRRLHADWDQNVFVCVCARARVYR